MNKAKNRASDVALSVIIPVANQEAVLTKLFDRLYPVLDGLGTAYEVVFVDCGSRDRSMTLLRQQYKLRMGVTRVLLLRGDVGRDAAVMAGFEVAVGNRVVTLEASLRHPPEAIPRLLAEMAQGHDYVSGFCCRHRDSRWRDSVSKVMNRVRERITRIRMTDPTCMLCAYDRALVDVLNSDVVHGFIPASACRYAADPAEVEIEPEPAAAGRSEYPLYESIHRNLALITGFSRVPLQLFSLVGVGVACSAFALAGVLAVWISISGHEVGGIFILSVILLFLMGLILFGIGLLGGYLQNLCGQSRSGSSYLVREHLHPHSGVAE